MNFHQMTIIIFCLIGAIVFSDIAQGQELGDASLLLYEDTGSTDGRDTQAIVPRTEKPGPFLAWPLPSNIGKTNITMLPDSSWTHNLLGISDCPPFPPLIDDGPYPTNGSIYPGHFEDVALPGTTRDRVRFQNIDNGGSWLYNAISCYRSTVGIGPDHAGTDIAANNGTSVYAAASGTVVAVQDVNECVSGSPNEYRVVVRHNNVNGSGQVWFTVYLHVRSPTVSVNDTVSLGTTLASVGCDHLHFETSVGDFNSQRNHWGIDQAPWDGCLWQDSSLCEGNNNGCCGCGRNVNRGVADFPLFTEDGIEMADVVAEYDVRTVEKIPQLHIDDGANNFAKPYEWVALNWQDATDADGEVVGYLYYWGQDKNGESAEFTPSTTFQPSTLQTTGTFYLRVSAEDNDGNHSPWQTVATIIYDDDAPTGSLKFAHNAQASATRATRLELLATDLTSPVEQMRLRVNGEDWGQWQPYRSEPFIELGQNEGLHTVMAQVRDAARNESAVLSAEIILDLSNDRPTSTSYALPCSVVSAGGGMTASTNYVVESTVGQPYETGHANSESYELSSGYQNCLSTTSIPTGVGVREIATMHRTYWVVWTLLIIAGSLGIFIWFRRPNMSA